MNHDFDNIFNKCYKNLIFFHVNYAHSMKVYLYIKSLFSRCGSYVKMYLPDSLKLPNQPTPPADACILHEVNDIFRVFVFRGVTGGAMGQTLR